MTCSLKNTYRLIKEDDEITVITDDGGIALIRAVEDLDEDSRITTIILFSMKIPQDFTSVTHDIWEELSNKITWCDDTATVPFDDVKHIEFVLKKFGYDLTTCTRNDELFANVEF